MSKKLTAPGIPRQSPIHVLTRPKPANIQRSGIDSIFWQNYYILSEKCPKSLQHLVFPGGLPSKY